MVLLRINRDWLVKYCPDIHISVQIYGDVIRSGVIYEILLEAPATILGMLVLKLRFSVITKRAEPLIKNQAKYWSYVEWIINMNIYNVSNFTTVLTPQLPV